MQDEGLGAVQSMIFLQPPLFRNTERAVGRNRRQSPCPYAGCDAKHSTPVGSAAAAAAAAAAALVDVDVLEREADEGCPPSSSGRSEVPL
jgi:hypothetical protein